MKRNASSQSHGHKKRYKPEVICIDCSSSSSSDSDSDDDVNMKETKKQISVQQQVIDESSDDDDVMIIDADEFNALIPTSNPSSSSSSSSSSSNSTNSSKDDEIEIIGSTGKNALSDFPHARFNCVNYIFKEGPLKFCDQCYCYVCDGLASACGMWQTHCQASHENASWRQQRKVARQRKNAPPTAANSSSSSSSSSSSAVAAAGSVGAFATYQARMAQRRANAMQYALSYQQRQMQQRAGRNGLNLQSSLMQRIMNACSQIYPMEISSPAGLLQSTVLRTYQKQSLAFMVNRERGTNDDDYKTAPMNRNLFRRQVGKSDYAHTFYGIKTGILASEVGMGKSLVCIALVLANKASCKRMSVQKFNEATRPVDTKSYSLSFEKQMKKDPNNKNTNLKVLNQRMNQRICQTVCKNDLETQKYKVKTTVISTTNTIVGQWYDEIKKFAPSLNVKVHHGSYKSSPDFFNASSKSALQDVDILLTVNTTAPPAWCARLTFHRVIVDEIHQYFIPYYHSKNIWGVTATPFEKIVNIFKKFGQNGYSGMRLSNLWSGASSGDAGFTAFVEAMNVFMIRHTKNQKIEGQAALKLPPMPKTTISVTMSESEQNAYLMGRSSVNLSRTASALTAVGIDNKLVRIRSATLSQNKLLALKKDYSALLAENPSASVVIFSNFAESISRLSWFLKREFGNQIQGYYMKPSSAAKSRHTAIRDFQDASNTRPKVLAISYKTGQCGITLTAASRVYLLEPCLLPSDEVQAAGRISRLGQTKEISLVRLVAKNTIDEGIMEMHSQLASGAKKFTDAGSLPASCWLAMLKKGGPDTAPPIVWRENCHVPTKIAANQVLTQINVIINGSIAKYHNAVVSSDIKKQKCGYNHLLHQYRFNSRAMLMTYLADDVTTKIQIGNGIYTDQVLNSAHAGMYDTNPCLKYVEKFQPTQMYAWQHSPPKRWRIKFDADIKTEKSKVIKFLFDVCKYGLYCK